MRRFSIPVSVFSLVLVGLALLGVRPGVIAQDSTPAALAGHPLVGAWLLDVDMHDPANAPSLAIFHDDGTYIQSDVDGSNGIGSWEATGPNTGAATVYFQFPNETGGFGGATKVRATLEVDAAGDGVTAEYTVEFLGPDGTSSGELGPTTAVAERIAVEPSGTPVGPLVPPAAATPTA